MPGKAGASSKAKEEKELHVAIANPDEMRMSILESAKQSVGMLQKEMKLYEIKRQKLEAFREMRELFAELINLNMRLEKVMPIVKMSNASVKKELERDIEKVERPAEMIVSRSRFDELEMELADIEKRMSSLK